MAGDFDFLNDEPAPQPNSRTAHGARAERSTDRPPDKSTQFAGPPQAEPVDDEELPDFEPVIASGPIAPKPRPPVDDRPAPRPPYGQRKGKSPLLVAGIALGALLVVGAGVTILLVVRSGTKEPEKKAGTTPVAGPISRPAEPTPKPPADPNSPSQEVVEKVKKATLRILVRYKNGKTAAGSGFVEKSSGLVVTNAHVVGLTDPDDGGPDVMNLIVNSGQDDKEYPLAGEVIAHDKDNDLALIEPSLIVVGERHVVPEGLIIPKSPQVVELQNLFVFGFPLSDRLGSEIAVRPTRVISVRKDGARLRRIDVEGGMTFGNSGGPVVDVKGNVIGVAVAGLKDDTIRFAIPGEKVHDLIAKRRK
jgi:hypothetical protein